MKYAELLNKKIIKHNVDVYLVNTGWVGGSPSSNAKRISIKDTRSMITSILNGSINNTRFEIENYFGLYIPNNVDNVDSKILNPIESWENKEEYHKEALKLTELFKENFKVYGEEVKYLLNSGPII